MLNPIEKFKVVILHLNRDLNHWCVSFETSDSNPYSSVEMSVIYKNSFEYWNMYNNDVMMPDLPKKFILFCVVQVKGVP